MNYKDLLNDIEDFRTIYNEIGCLLNENWDSIIQDNHTHYDIVFRYYKHKTKDLIFYYDMGLVWSDKKQSWRKSKSPYNQPAFLISTNNTFDYLGNVDTIFVTEAIS